MNQIIKYTQSVNRHVNLYSCQYSSASLPSPGIVSGSPDSIGAQVQCFPSAQLLQKSHITLPSLVRLQMMIVFFYFRAFSSLWENEQYTKASSISRHSPTQKQCLMESAFLHLWVKHFLVKFVGNISHLKCTEINISTSTQKQDMVVIFVKNIGQQQSKCS